MMKAPARLLVLTYHRVLESFDPLRPAQTYRDQFDIHLSLLRRFFRTFTLSEALSRLRDGRLPRRSVVITFDDGYLDNADVALPMLRAHGLPATFFIATGYLDGGLMWNDRIIEAVRRTRHERLDLTAEGLGVVELATVEQRRSALRDILSALKYLSPAERDAATGAIENAAGGGPAPELMMQPADVRRLHAAGMEVGAHTVSHPILSRVDDAEAAAEITDSKRAAETIIDANVPAFAYPNGRPGEDFDAGHAGMVRRAGFDWAVTTAPGPVRTGCDPFQVGRYSPYGTSRPKLLLRILRGYFDDNPVTASAGHESA